VLAINTTDGKVFIKKDVSGTETIVEIGEPQTAAEILAAIKTVDGTGSDLNADKLGGIQRFGFLRSNADDTFENILTGNAPIVFDGTLATFDPDGDNSDTATDVAIGLESGHRIAGYSNGSIRTLFEWNSSNDISIGQSGTGLINGINLLPGSSGEAKVNGNKIWHAGNHGSGTGLDADKLDGQEGSYYLDYNNFTNTPSNSAAGPIALTKYTISTNVTLPSGYNGLSVGPVEVSNGKTVEVPQNSCWRILD